MSASRDRELFIPASDVRVGDRLIPSGIRIVAIENTVSGDVRFRTESGASFPMPPTLRVYVSRRMD